MLSWIAIIIAAFALMRVWQVYSHEKMKRKAKLRHITRRLKQKEEKDSQDKKPENDELTNGEN